MEIVCQVTSTKDYRGRYNRIALVGCREVAQIIPYKNGDGWQVIVPGKDGESLAGIVHLGVSRTVVHALEDLKRILTLIHLSKNHPISDEFFKEMARQKCWMKWPASRIQEFIEQASTVAYYGQELFEKDLQNDDRKTD